MKIEGKYEFIPLSVTFTEPVVKKLTLAQQYFVKSISTFLEQMRWTVSCWYSSQADRDGD